MKNTWVVVADASRARIFAASKNLSVFDEVTTLAHPASRMHEQEMTSDLPGRSFDSSGDGRHAMGQTEDPKAHQHDVFARQVSDHIEELCQQDTTAKLILIAAPKTLGLLRQHLSDSTRNKITQEVDKDLTQHSVQDIKDHLPDFLPV